MAEKRINIVITLCLIAVIFLIAAFYFATKIVFPEKYSEEIASASAVYGIDENIIKAVIWTESKYNESAVSSKGASGLMQLMPQTRAEQSEISGIAADCSPYSEIMLGTGYLARMLLDTGDLETALMAYNAGLANVRKWSSPFPESAEYVRRVFFARNIYKYLK